MWRVTDACSLRSMMMSFFHRFRQTCAATRMAPVPSSAVVGHAGLEDLAGDAALGPDVRVKEDRETRQVAVVHDVGAGVFGHDAVELGRDGVDVEREDAIFP